MIDSDFQKTIEEIFFYSVRYGAVKHAEENQKIEDFNPKRFYKLCNDGFKLAQQKILGTLKESHANLTSLKERLKDSRRKKDKDSTNQLAQEIGIESYKEELIRNLAFTIAWQIFNGKREILARLYTGESGAKDLTGAGFEGILQAADDINSKSDNFALISDLTNNIQIGDLLVIYPDRHELIEVKTGKKNEEAFRLIKFYETNNIEISEERLEKSFDKHLSKQILRIKKQEDKSSKVKKIIETDQGADPKHKDTNVHLKDSSIPDETYHSEIIDLLEKLKEKDWAYTSITGVINVGAYKHDWRFHGKEVLKGINNGYPVHDLMSTLGITIAEPIFAKPFEDKTIMDIAFGRIKIYVGIDFDQFIKFSNDFGLPMRWSTTKEFAKYVSNIPFNNKEIFSFENKGLVIGDSKTKESTLFVGQGMLIRMLFDHIQPYTLVMNRKVGFEEFKRKKADNIK